jgi:uncharacterized protein
MGPLAINEIISENTNLFLAFIIGIGFGFVLEQSGFSSSRKLAGVFYGYDTVVLKVFFTGAITTMLGLLFFSLFGWIDLKLVYVNPTYLTSAIVGGIIMGAGFIMGGYCPEQAFVVHQSVNWMHLSLSEDCLSEYLSSASDMTFGMECILQNSLGRQK